MVAKAKGISIDDVLVDFCEDGGLRISNGLGFVDYNDGFANKLMGLDCAGVIEGGQVALFWQDAILGNFILARKTGSSPCLLQLDKTPMAGLGLLCSHTVACRWNDPARSFEIANNDGTWFLLSNDFSQHQNFHTWQTLRGTFRIQLFDFIEAKPSPHLEDRTGKS